MWDNMLPSLLIGLREGLEAGLIVSVLVATLVRAGEKAKVVHVWTGVLAAIGLSLSFGLVLTFTSANLSGKAQEAFGGVTSLVAVVFVTGMVFWMRKNARSFAGELKEKVRTALTMGAGMLVVTAFLAVGREGLETALFLWTTADTADESTGPMIGAAIGLIIASALCWGLYRQIVHINLTRFFKYTGVILIVIASGVLGYGVYDLQEAGWLPGLNSNAFNLEAHIDEGSWYATLVAGTLNITPKMSWLQIVAYGAYLAVVLALFLRAVRVAAPVTAKAKAETGAGAGDESEAGAKTEAGDVAGAGAEAAAGAGAESDAGAGATAGAGDESGAGARDEPEPEPAGAGRGRGPVPRWSLPAALVGVPLVVAAVVVAVSDGKPETGATVTIGANDCAKGFKAPKPGRHVFKVENTGKRAAEIYLIDPVRNAVYGEVEGVAPGTTRDMPITIGTGSYAWRCVPTGGKVTTSAAVRVSGGSDVTAVAPVSEKDLEQPLATYRGFVDKGLANLEKKTGELHEQLEDGDTAEAKKTWLEAHVQYESLGAAYGTFGDFDAAINGRTAGLPGGVKDPDFTGFHRIEYGLWRSGESSKTLAKHAGKLASDVAKLRKDFPEQEFDPGDLSLRSHEVSESTVQHQLTGVADYGSGTTLATAEANLKGTRKLLSLLKPLIDQRNPKVPPLVDSWIARAEQILRSARDGDSWTPVGKLDAPTRQRLNGAMNQLVEELAPIPALLEIRKA